MEASADVNVALVQSSKTRNKYKTVKGLLNTGVLSTVLKKKIRKYPSQSEKVLE